MSATAMDVEPAPGHVLDVEAYAALYSGRTKVARLLFIADRGGPALQLDALRLAADSLKKGVDTATYQQVMERIGGRLGAAYTLDKEWVDATDKRAAQTLERLDGEFNANRGSMEAVRLGFTDLADFLLSRGDVQSAFKNYVRSRDYCSTPQQVVALCLSVIQASLELSSFTTHVQNYVQKGESSGCEGGGALEAHTAAKLKCAAGLALLEQQKYKLAARRFSECPADLGAAFSEVLSSQDVATYCVLCALATFDRQELRAHVVDNIPLRSYLETVPEVRELVADFHGSRYSAALSALERIKPALLLDIHLHDHVTPLLADIRQGAIAAYVAPFSRVRLDAMATALNTSVPALDKELAALIQENLVPARIDQVGGVLYARHADARKATFARALAAGEAYERDTKALLVRASLMQHDVVQKRGPGRGGGGGGGDTISHRNDPHSLGLGGYGGGHHGGHFRERERGALARASQVD